MTGQYAVLARLRDDAGRLTSWAVVDGSTTNDWAQVQRRWDAYDRALRNGRLYTVAGSWSGRVVQPATTVAYLAVRGLDDPAVAYQRGPWANRWADVARTTVQLVVADNRPAKHEGSLQRRWGKVHGYHGHPGGWIYRGSDRDGTCQRTSTQGWWHLVPRDAIRAVAGGGWIMVEEV